MDARSPAAEKNCGRLGGTYRSLVRRNATGLYKGETSVPIEIHERVGTVGIEGDETPRGFQHPEHLRGAESGIRQVMDDAAQQDAIRRGVLKRKCLDITFKIG